MNIKNPVTSCGGVNFFHLSYKTIFMKPILTILTSFITISVSFGQITTTKIPPVPDKIVKTPYDSLENYLGENVYKYIGQDLYLNGRPESLREYGYSGFFIDYPNDLLSKSKVYKCCDRFNSKYDELVGKYFTVIDVLKHPKSKENEYLYGKKFFLKLIEKESKDTVYYEYNSKSNRLLFPFIVVGYWEKYKKSNVGEQFVLGYIDDELLNMITGEKIDFINGSTWKCVDLTIEEKYFQLILVFENDKGEKIKSTTNKGSLYYWEKSVADNYKTKFGIFWNVILERKVRIGMTTDMCRLSWDDPKSINETILSGKKTEQWVYEDNYLYFDNNILTAIQKQ